MAEPLSTPAPTRLHLFNVVTNPAYTRHIPAYTLSALTADPAATLEVVVCDADAAAQLLPLVSALPPDVATRTTWRLPQRGAEEPADGRVLPAATLEDSEAAWVAALRPFPHLLRWALTPAAVLPRGTLVHVSDIDLLLTEAVGWWGERECRRLGVGLAAAGRPGAAGVLSGGHIAYRVEEGCRFTRAIRRASLQQPELQLHDERLLFAAVVAAWGEAVAAKAHLEPHEDLQARRPIMGLHYSPSRGPGRPLPHRFQEQAGALPWLKHLLERAAALPPAATAVLHEMCRICEAEARP